MWQWDNSVSYDKSFGQHRINALFSTSASRIDHDWTQVGATGYNTSLFSYKSLGAAYKTDRHSVSSEWTTSTMLSYVARGTYSFADRYHFTGTLRADGSSKFIAGKQWGVFPAGSFKWDVLKEDFIPAQNIFSDLGVRIGYGVVGNQNVEDYRFQTLFDTRIANGTATYVKNEYMGNVNFTWEQQRQGNLGLDMAFLSNRLRFTADAFLIQNKDLLLAHQVNQSTGHKMILENVGTIENKGVELSLNAGIVRSADFEWNASLTFSLDRNKVTALYGRTDHMYNINDGQVQKENNLFVGEARNTLYMWKTGGIAQADDFSTDEQGRRLFRGQLVDYDPDGKEVENYLWSSLNVNPGDLYPLDVNGDGTVNENDRTIVGSTDPKFYGGFATDVAWKGISLSAVFTYSYGAKKLSPYYESLMGSTGSSAATVDLLDRWTPENTGAMMPRPIAGFDYPHYSPGQMDFSVQDASFLRLSALTLAYTFPKGVLDRVKLSNLRLYFTGSNLFCLTPYKGYDPEMGDWYPATKMYVFGLNVSF
jgi:TonB-linked SusC/RagA family outer membrane protein